ncbi:MAG: hypothetical protein WCL10_15345 [Novosphingobium sp.]|uniref:hypothetical protein n=1 Tax=Novosphingobium sp. TaxID=1874826 RepID=UPI0030188B43
MPEADCIVVCTTSRFRCAIVLVALIGLILMEGLAYLEGWGPEHSMFYPIFGNALPLVASISIGYGIYLFSVIYNKSSTYCAISGGILKIAGQRRVKLCDISSVILKRKWTGLSTIVIYTNTNIIALSSFFCLRKY